MRPAIQQLVSLSRRRLHPQGAVAEPLDLHCLFWPELSHGGPTSAVHAPKRPRSGLSGDRSVIARPPRFKWSKAISG